MIKIYAFDVDETLEISSGPVKLDELVKLREEGHIVGLCGNWALFCRIVNEWWKLVSFINVYTRKDDFLRELKAYIPANEYIMVGNILGVSGMSDDKGAAERVGWRFIQEKSFANGER